MAYFSSGGKRLEQFTIVLHLKRIEVALAKVCWRLVTICLHSAVVALSRAEKATSVEPFSYGYNGRKGWCSARLS